VIDTKRLLIRPFTESDLQKDLSWFFDEEVMKFIPNGRDKNTQELNMRINNYINHYKKYGFSKYLLIYKSNEEPIGDAGLLRIDNTEYIELGYRLKKTYWGNGISIEACQGIIDYAFNNLYLDKINAITEIGNKKSIHILANKLGFCYLNSEEIYGENMLLYELVNTSKIKSSLLNNK
jgi:RimJ/RimL family protein N-acetyltransferase